VGEKLSVGDRIPSFALASQSGELVRIEDLLSRGPVVIYFYPKDDTPGCTAEACGFRDHYEEFQTAGAEVVGISADAADVHRGFASRHRLPFVLLSDPDNAVRKQFGVSRHAGLIPGRETFIVDQDGIVVHHFRSLLDAMGHVREARQIVEKLAANRA
jgi:peroxiredoxin Q/BCP